MFRVFLFLAVVGWSQIVRADLNCQEFMQDELGDFRPSQDLRIKPVGAIKYEANGFVTTRWTDAYLEVSQTDDLQHVANVLASGAHLNQEEILTILRDLLADKETASISLLHFVPEIPRQYTNTFDRCSRANCFNATLAWHNSNLPVTYTDPKEMKKALLDEYRPLEAGEHLRYGDPVVFERHKGGSFNHSAIFIDHNLVWHKSSADEHAPWTFEPFTESIRRSFREELLIMGRRPSLSLYRALVLN